MNKTTTMLALDLEKAFDSVWHEGLINKMIREEIPKNLIEIIKSYLEERKNIVNINSKHSSEYISTTGIPQGGSLSTTLFLLYINDIPKNPRTRLALFADDTAILAEAKMERTTNNRIQQHVEELQEYFQKWKIKINPAKTQLINFNKKIRPTNQDTIKIENTPIETKEEITYLGTILDRKLTFKKHIDKIRNNAQRAIKTIYPFINHNCKLPKKMKLQLYTAYVKPILTYNTAIWSSAADSYIKKLQAIENKTYRIILNKKTAEINNKELHEEIGGTPLLHIIYKRWKKFFNHDIYKTPLTENITQIQPDNTPFRLKHKLIHYRMYEYDA